MKIHILGGPGSGKTTLAARLAARFSVPHHDLDQILWRQVGMEGYVAEACQLAAQPDWISEGVFVGWVDPLLEAADCILYMDVPWHVAYWRVLRRHFVKTLQGTNPYKTSQLWPFLGFVHGYYTEKPDANPAVYAAGQRYIDQRAAQSALPSQSEFVKMLPDEMPMSAAFTLAYLNKYRARLFMYRRAQDLPLQLSLLESATLRQAAR